MMNNIAKAFRSWVYDIFGVQATEPRDRESEQQLERIAKTLKPCPHCGEPVVLMQTRRGWLIKCTWCLADMDSPVMDDLIENWNWRAS